MPRQPGGGTYGYGVQGTVATLLGSAVVNNTASSGDGGILGILSANSATSSGGAISSVGGLTVSFSTISAYSARSGGGIAALTGAITTLKATFLAGNAAISGPNCASTVTSLGDNLIGDADGGSGVRWRS